ncbi:unnamed protein product [Caenorhabditis brenneri]
MSKIFQILFIFAILAALQVNGFLFPTYSSGYNYDCYPYGNGYDYGNGYGNGYGYGNNGGYYGGYNNGYYGK